MQPTPLLPSHPCSTAYMLSFLLPQLLESVAETLLFANIIYWRVICFSITCCSMTLFPVEGGVCGGGAG